MKQPSHKDVIDMGLEARDTVLHLRSSIYDDEYARVYSDAYDHGDEYETLKARLKVAFHHVETNGNWYRYPECVEKKAHYDAAIAIIQHLLFTPPHLA